MIRLRRAGLKPSRYHRPQGSPRFRMLFTDQVGSGALAVEIAPLRFTARCRSRALFSDACVVDEHSVELVKSVGSACA